MDVSHQIVVGLEEGGIRASVYLPDSMLSGVISVLAISDEIDSYPCSREDEGVAMAIGLYIGGRPAVCVMEGSGVALSGLALARAQTQRTPVVIIASHTDGVGEMYDYHATSRTAAGVLHGLDIPFARVDYADDLAGTTSRAAQTALSQRSCFALLLAPHIFAEKGAA